jgi:hypothetical protein
VHIPGLGVAALDLCVVAQYFLAFQFDHQACERSLACLGPCCHGIVLAFVIGDVLTSGGRVYGGRMRPFCGFPMERRAPLASLDAEARLCTVTVHESLLTLSQ